MIDMSEKNICRPVIIYNKLMPQNPNPKDKFDYVVLGECDGIEIKKPLVYHNGSKKPLLEQVKGSLMETIVGLDGSYNPQILFCFRKESLGSRVQDENFWNEESLFLFITTIHVASNDLDKLLDLKEYLEERCRIEGYLESICYLTLENNDMILCMKSSEYRKAALFINKFHGRSNCLKIKKDKKVHLMYTHTTLGLNLKRIKNLKEDQSMQLSLKKQKIDTITFSFVVKNRMKFDKLKDSLDQSLGSNNGYYQIFGNEDFQILYNNVSWDKIIPLFDVETQGVLTIKNPEYIDAIYSAETQIAIEEKNLRKPVRLSFLVEDQENVNNTEIIYKLAEELQKKYDEIEENQEFFSEKYKILKHILNTLVQYERADFSNYIFAAILRPLARLIEHDELFKNNENRVSKFIQSIERLIQATENTSQHFYQIPDYSMYSSDIPIKLSAFYCAYANLLQKYISCFSEKHTDAVGGNYDYSFLVIPSINDLERTCVVFHKQKPGNRILVIEIPELYMFNLSRVCRVIAHEISHYIGGKMRNRATRAEKLKNIVSVAYVYYIGMAVDKKEKGIGSYMKDINILQDLEKNLKNIFTSELEKSENKKYWTYFLELEGDKSFENYAFYLEKAYTDILKDIFSVDDKMNIYNNIILNYSQKNHKEDKGFAFDKILRYKKELTKFLYGEYSYQIKLGTIEKLLEKILKMLSETFADISMIMTLNLDVVEYLNACTTTYRIDDKYTVEDILKTTGIYRLYFVVRAMIEDEGHQEWSWEEVGNEMADDINEMRSRLCAVLLYIDQTIKGATQNYCGILKDNRFLCDDNIVQAVFMDKKIAMEIISYLRECQKSFYEICSEKENDAAFGQTQDQIREIHKIMSQDNDIEKILDRMHNVIELYQQDIYNEFSDIS